MKLGLYNDCSISNKILTDWPGCYLEESDNQYWCRVEQSARHDHIVILCPPIIWIIPSQYSLIICPAKSLHAQATSITEEVSGGGWNHQRFCSEITTLSLSSSQWWPIALSKVASKIIGKNNFYHKERAKAGLKWAKESKNFLCEVSMTKCDGAVLVSPCNAEWSHPND